MTYHLMFKYRSQHSAVVQFLLQSFMSSPENATDSSSNSSLLDNDQDNSINNNSKHFVLPTELYKNLLANAVLGKAETMHFSSPGQSNVASIPAFPRNLLFSSTAESTEEVVSFISSLNFIYCIRIKCTQCHIVWKKSDVSEVSISTFAEPWLVRLFSGLSLCAETRVLAQVSPCVIFGG